MDSSLHEVWQAAAGSPFLPTVGKGSQFFVAFVLLMLGLSITGVFALSESTGSSIEKYLPANICLDRSLVNVFALGVPASLATA
jgi:hypothetical protein